MKPQDIRDLYPVTPALHSRVARTLGALEDAQPIRFKKSRRIHRLVIAFAAIALLGAFTTAAYATNLFGLLSERVGKYGLNLSVVGETEQSPDTEKKHVKLKLGYIPEGYQPITDEDGFTDPYKYSYGGKSITDRWGFSFLIYGSDEYDQTETGIIGSTEETVNGRRIIFMTQQFDYDGEPQYLAAEYFDEWDTVVVGYSVNESELHKIMEHLDLEEDTDYVEPPTIGEEYHDEVDDYTYLGVRDEYRFVGVGDSFGYSEYVYHENSDEIPPDFTVTVKSVEERDSFDGLDKDSCMYVFSRYFDENNRLITPYTRLDQENGDGIDTLTRRWETVTDRHFFVVTVEANANTDMENSNGLRIWAGAIEKQPDGSYAYPDSHADVILIYQDASADPYGQWTKGETHTFVYGVLADDELLDQSCLIFESKEYFADHRAETFEEADQYICVMLKGAAK